MSDLLNQAKRQLELVKSRRETRAQDLEPVVGPDGSRVYQPGHRLADFQWIDRPDPTETDLRSRGREILRKHAVFRDRLQRCRTGSLFE